MKEVDNVFSYANQFGVHKGLTARDYIAIQAMVGLSANPNTIERGFDEIAVMAYRQADEMIKRSNR